MDIALNRVFDVALNDVSWLASAKGTTTTRTITVDPAAGFTANAHYPDGYLKSGLPLGIVTATGLYGLYDSAVSDGRQTIVGFLYGQLKLTTSATGLDTTKKLGGALLWEGVVKLARLQAINNNVALGSPAQTALANRFRFEA